MGLLTKDDSTLYRGFFNEVAHLLGVTAQYYYIKDRSFTINAEMVPEAYSEPIELDIIYEEHPKVSTLRRLGWVSELPDDKPIVARLPYRTPNLEKGCRLDLPHIDNLAKYGTNSFKVTDLASIDEYPDCWVVKLAPIFETSNDHINPDSSSQNDYSDRNYNYLSI